MSLLGVRTVYLHVTRACNLRCAYCYFDAGEPMEGELSFDELRELFRDIVTIGPRRLVFTGGEPLLRRDLIDLARDFRSEVPKRRIILCLMSNGILIDEDMAERIVEAFDEVRISIDGPMEVNDRLRGKGSFEGAMRAIHNLRGVGMHLGVTITVTRENVSHLSTFLPFLLEKEFITEFHLTPFRPFGRGSNREDLLFPWREAQLIVAGFWREHFGNSLKLEGEEAYKLSCRSCGIGGYVNIHPNGAVYPCHVLSVPQFLLGNLKDRRLSEILRESPLLRMLRGLDLPREAATNERIRALLDNAICLGEVYRDAPMDFMGLIKKASRTSSQPS